MTDSVSRSKYFARTVVYARRGDQVVIVDIHDASVTQPLEPWLGKALLLADGTHTVQQLIDFVGRQYDGGPPPSLGETLESVVDRLQQAGFIALSDEPVELPYYLSLAADDQDAEQANRLMTEDGFQQGEQTRSNPDSI